MKKLPTLSNCTGGFWLQLGSLVASWVTGIGAQQLTSPLRPYILAPLILTLSINSNALSRDPFNKLPPAHLEPHAHV